MTDMEYVLRQLLHAAYAYGRPVSNVERSAFNKAWDAAQDLLAATPDGREKMP